VIVYALSVANTGAGAVDAGSLVVTDVLAPETALYVGPGGNAAVVLTEGSPPSGLAFDPASDVAYSSAPGGGPPFDHAPSPDADGFDPAVTGLRITPGGALPGDDGGGAPAFTLRYRVRVD
jgi:hypothetical protein